MSEDVAQRGRSRNAVQQQSVYCLQTIYRKQQLVCCLQVQHSPVHIQDCGAPVHKTPIYLKPSPSDSIYQNRTRCRRACASSMTARPAIRCCRAFVRKPCWRYCSSFPSASARLIRLATSPGAAPGGAGGRPPGGSGCNLYTDSSCAVGGIFLHHNSCAHI